MRNVLARCPGLFLKVCRSYHGTATKKGLKLNEKALLSKSFFASLKTKFKLAIVTGRPRKVLNRPCCLTPAR